MDRVTLTCFAASYGTALLLELWHLLRRRPVHRLLADIFGGAGLLAQTTYLAVQPPSLGGQFGLLLVLSWILAIFYLFGSLHHTRQAWGVFILPVILILIGLGTAFGDETPTRRTPWLALAHGTLLVLAAVGTCVGFVASIMYLIQARRLKAKALPGQGLRLPSLERLEMMNRRSLTFAFPLLTAGMILGLMMLRDASGWTDPRVLTSMPLWVVFALMAYLRFGMHVQGKRMAVWTIIAFLLMLVTLVMPHMAPTGGES